MFLSRERSIRMQLSHIANVCIAYFTHASGMILYVMAIEHVELHVEFQDRLQTLIDCAHEQLPRPLETKQRCINLRRAPTHTLSFTVAKPLQATADQHDRELVPSLSHHSPL